VHQSILHGRKMEIHRVPCCGCGSWVAFSCKRAASGSFFWRKISAGLDFKSLPEEGQLTAHSSHVLSTMFEIQLNEMRLLRHCKYFAKVCCAQLANVQSLLYSLLDYLGRAISISLAMHDLG